MIGHGNTLHYSSQVSHESINGLQLFTGANNPMAIPVRREIQPGLRVMIVEKQNQSTGQLTEGVVMRLLTSSPIHPHGIKVMLVGGKVGRVQAIVN
jgi:uncharacterized repeat protein (TIGR03833 family)